MKWRITFKGISTLAISISGLSKKYNIGKTKCPDLRTFLSSWFRMSTTAGAEFWALKNVSLDIAEGEVVGIVGRNGAGKSTLLKLLSRITRPTTGRIELDGRVAALLEVGTGFHPELTGRENIFLNGTILGMSRAEVKRKFDDIVQFSGVTEFIDMPVKHFSSGMHVRLAFAVAAHLEPEILLIDEVLAVGDASFQKKCLGKMKDVAKHGRTVLFVSHDLSAISSLCSRAVIVDGGEIVADGATDAVLHEYLASSADPLRPMKRYLPASEASTDQAVVLNLIQLVDSRQTPVSTVHVDQQVGIYISFDVHQDGLKPIPNVHLFHAQTGKLLVAIDDCDHHTFNTTGRYSSTMWFPRHFFNQGLFSIGVAISSLDPVRVHAADYHAIGFQVIDRLNSPTRNGYVGPIGGVLRPQLTWENARSPVTLNSVQSPPDKETHADTSMAWKGL